MRIWLDFIVNYILKILSAIGIIYFFMIILVFLTNTDVWSQYGNFESTMLVIRKDLLDELKLYKNIPYIGNLFNFNEASQWNLNKFYRTTWIELISAFVSLVTFKPLKETYNMISNFIDGKIPSLLFFVGDFISYPMVFIFAVIAKHMLKTYFITEYLYKRGTVITFFFIIFSILVISYAISFILYRNRLTRSAMTINIAGSMLCDLISVTLIPFFSLCFTELVVAQNAISNEHLTIFAIMSFIIIIGVYFIEKTGALKNALIRR